MSVRSSVVSALTATAPVYWQKWRGDTDPPATYFVFTTMVVPDEWHDDAQKTRKYYVYLNLYSETDYIALVPAIRTAMEGAGFTPVDERDVSDGDAQYAEHGNYCLATTWSIREAV